MSPQRIPEALAENEGLVFAGVRVPAGCILGKSDAERMLAVRNQHGKSNADVLRPYLDATDFKNQLASDYSGADRGPPPTAFRENSALGRWVVDFPADLAPEEASLYARPWEVFEASGGRLHERSDPMRIAIARIDTFLAAPTGRVPRGFLKVDSETLPGSGLAVVATDDDFVGAVLQSGVFAAWIEVHGGALRVGHVASFPFPWPPRTQRGSLSRVQLELRDSVVRGRGDDLDDAVATAYGWGGEFDAADVVSRLRSLSLSRPVAP